MLKHNTWLFLPRTQETTRALQIDTIFCLNYFKKSTSYLAKFRVTDVCLVALRSKFFNCCYKYSGEKYLIVYSSKKLKSLYFFSHYYYFEHSYQKSLGHKSLVTLDQKLFWPSVLW